MKRISLPELEESARQLTKRALERFEIPDELRERMALMTLFEGDDRVFVLYVPGESRGESRDIARVRMNSITGEGVVEVFGSRFDSRSSVNAQRSEA